MIISQGGERASGSQVTNNHNSTKVRYRLTFRGILGQIVLKKSQTIIYISN